MIYIFLIFLQILALIMDKIFRDVFHVLAQSPFSLLKWELDYYHRNLNKFKHSKLGNFNKNSEKLEFDGKFIASYRKANFQQLRWKIAKNSTKKHFKEAPILLDFENFSTIICSLLSEKTFPFLAWTRPHGIQIFCKF